MKRVLSVVVAGCLICVTPALAVDGVQILGSYINPISGTRYEMVQAYTNDVMGHNQSVIYVSATDRSGKEINPNNMVTHDGASSPGWLGAGMAGFIGNLPNAGGLIGGAALLRPSSTNVNQTGGGVGSNTGDGAGGINISQSQSSKAVAKQTQAQSQAQVQSQTQSQAQSQINKGSKINIHTNNGNHYGQNK